jgi:CHAD domain-containing protein
MDQNFVSTVEVKTAVYNWLRESELLSRNMSGLPDKAVHDIRVCMKKARAALKLAAPQLIESENDKDLNALRTIAGSLREQRSRSVLRKTLRKLKKQHPSLFMRLKNNELIGSLKEKKHPAVRDAEMQGDTEAGVNKMLRKTLYRLRFRSMGKIDPKLLFERLGGTYRELEELYVSCRNTPKPKKLHRFRKRAKDLLYQLGFFRPVSPGRIFSLEKQLIKLTRNLGRYHDLQELVLVLPGESEDLTSDNNITELILRIRNRQDYYLSKTWPLAFTLFCPGKRLEDLMGKGVRHFSPCYSPEAPGSTP